MAFNVGAGLAQMGQATSQFTGLAALEAQKSGLEMEKLKVANDLAMERESKGRQESAALQSAENQRHEGFLGAEGEKNRQATLEGHRISAGSAAATAAAHLQGIRMQLDAAAEQGDFRLGAEGEGMLVNRRTGKVTPILDADGKPKTFMDPEKAKAQGELITTTRNQLDSAVRLYETDLKQAQAELSAALKSPMAMTDPNKDPSVEAARKQIEQIRAQHEPKITALNNRLTSLYTQLAGKAKIDTTAGPTGAPSLDSFIRKPTEPETPATPGAGLINSFGGPR